MVCFVFFLLPIRLSDQPSNLSLALHSFSCCSFSLSLLSHSLFCSFSLSHILVLLNLNHTHSFLAMLRSFAAALTLASVAMAGCTRTYTVAAGDVCDSISKQNKVSTFQLSLDNNGVNDVCSNLQIGQELCLGTDNADCTDIYVVASGDTCSKISSAFSIDSATLLKNNPQIETGCTNIYIGEVLCVAPQVIAYPETVTITSETSPSYLASASAYEELPWCDE